MTSKYRERVGAQAMDDDLGTIIALSKTIDAVIGAHIYSSNRLWYYANNIRNFDADKAKYNFYKIYKLPAMEITHEMFEDATREELFEIALTLGSILRS